MEKCKQIAAAQRAEDEINRQRKNSQRHADDARYDEVMHRVNAQRLQRFDLAERARCAEFNDVGCADARQHQHRREQWAEFAHDDDHHRRTEVIRRADFFQRGNGLADNKKTQRQRDEYEHRHQRHAGAGNFLPDARLDDGAGDVEFIEHHAEGDERKRAEALNGQNGEK